jgi:hypothetical protein
MYGNHDFTRVETHENAQDPLVSTPTQEDKGTLRDVIIMRHLMFWPSCAISVGLIVFAVRAVF